MEKGLLTEGDIRRIVKETLREEEDRQEWMKYFRQRRYEEDVTTIAKTQATEMCSDKFKEIKLQLQLDTQKQVSTLTEERCRLLVPAVLKTEIQSYLKSLIKEDDQLAKSYRNYLSELKTIQDSNLQQMQNVGEYVFQDFRAKMENEMAIRLTKMIEGKMDEGFFVALLNQLSKENKIQVDEHVSKITTLNSQVSQLEKKCLDLQDAQKAQKMTNRKMEEDSQSIESRLSWLKFGLGLTNLTGAIGFVSLCVFYWQKTHS